MEEVCIFVITHKYCESKKVSSYNWLFVGAFKEKNRLNNYYYDDIAQNISKKNNYFCELTGLYWVWKNANNKIKGIVHYRRFFTKNTLSINEKYFLSEKEISEILKTNDCIVAERAYLRKETIRENYGKNHNIKDLEIVEDIIKNDYPDYFEDLQSVLNGNHYIPYNMFIANNTIFANYCDWLFAILEKAECRIDLSKYDKYQMRVFGFLSERLLYVWLKKNKIIYKEQPVVMTEETIYKRAKIRLSKLLKQLKINY